MKKVTLDDLDSLMGPSSVRKRVATELDTDHLACNYFELEPGETFGFGYHRHPGQEEVFYILEGTATFETEDGDIDVTADEVIRFAPGEWQLGRNDGAERVRALAMGAPADAAETDLRTECADCGGRMPSRIEMADDYSAVLTICEDCGVETGRYT